MTPSLGMVSRREIRFHVAKSDATINEMQALVAVEVPLRVSVCVSLRVSLSTVHEASLLSVHRPLKPHTYLWTLRSNNKTLTSHEHKALLHTKIDELRKTNKKRKKKKTSSAMSIRPSFLQKMTSCVRSS